MFHQNADEFKTVGEVAQALRKAGLETSNLVIGIDYTKYVINHNHLHRAHFLANSKRFSQLTQIRSNQWTGKVTFAGRNLHSIGENFQNPYQVSSLI